MDYEKQYSEMTKHGIGMSAYDGFYLLFEAIDEIISRLPVCVCEQYNGVTVEKGMSYHCPVHGKVTI